MAPCSANAGQIPRYGYGPFPWPKALPDQAQAVLAALREAAGLATAEETARRFKSPIAQVADLLETLVVLGQVRRSGEDRYTAG